MPLKEVLTIAQAAEYLGLSVDTMYRYANIAYLPAFKIGNRWRFRKSLLDKWMDEKMRETHDKESHVS